MRIKRCYKKGEKIRFKWYETPSDEFMNPTNFEIIDGLVNYDDTDSDIFDSIIVNNEDWSKFYLVHRDNILKNLSYEATN